MLIILRVLLLVFGFGGGVLGSITAGATAAEWGSSAS